MAFLCYMTRENACITIIVGKSKTIFHDRLNISFKRFKSLKKHLSRMDPNLLLKILFESRSNQTVSTRH